MADRERLERLINEVKRENVRIAQRAEYHMEYVRDNIATVQEVEKRKGYARSYESALTANNDAISRLKERLELLLDMEDQNAQKP